MVNMVSGLIFAVMTAGLLVSVWSSHYRYDLGTWFHSAKDRAIVDERNQARRDWLVLVQAVDQSDHYGIGAERLAELVKTRDRVRMRMDDLEDALRAIRAENTSADKIDRVMDRWRDKS